MLKKLLSTSVIATMTVAAAAPAFAADLVVYSARADELLKPVVAAYERSSGNKVTLVSDKADVLMERLVREGSNTQADVLITVDGGNLWQAAERGLFRPVSSSTLRSNIPSHLRDPKNQWFGLSVRARTIFYNPNKVKPSDLSTYADLANAKWKDKLCLRSAGNIYNQSLVATMIANHGRAATERTVKGWVDNLAIAPLSNDTAVLEAINAGRCDVGIANTYYYGRLVDKTPSVANNVRVFFADQDGKGTHVNVSGAGVLKHSKNAQEAQKFIEWLSGAEAQRLYADRNFEYPASPRVSWAPSVARWGTFKQDFINVSETGKNQRQAVMLMSKMGYK